MSRALEKVDGVRWVNVSLEKGRAEVRCRPDFENSPALLQAVSGAGFKATLIPEKDGPMEPAS